MEDLKSTFECRFSLDSTSISWMSRKQKSVAISTTETEYIATSMISCEVAWLQKLLCELFVHMMNTIVNLCDNQRWDSIIEESRI